MIDLTGSITSMGVLVVIASIGFCAAKVGLLDADFTRKLTQLLLKVTLPCMVLASVGGMDAASAGSQVGWAFLLAAAQFFLLLAAGALCNALLRVPAEERPIYLFMSVATNTGFIGLPVIAAIYGNDTTMLSSIFIMVIGFFVYSIGFSIIATPMADGGKRSIPWRAAVNPAMIASCTAIVLFFAGVQLPTVVQDAFDMVGGVTAPVAMMIVGQIVASADIKGVLCEWRLYLYTLIRQLVVPVLLFLVLRPVVPEEMVLGVFVVMFAMPVGSMASSFCAQFGRDQTLAAKGTILSTVLSFAIVPVLVLVMTMV